MNTKHLLKTAAQHHLTLAANETRKAARHTALADTHDELDQPNVAKLHRQLAKDHEACAGEHSERSAEFSDMVKAVDDSPLGKAALNVDRIIPDHVQGVIREFAGITAVPRNGAPTAVKGVAPEFQKFVEIEE